VFFAVTYKHTYFITSQTHTTLCLDIREIADNSIWQHDNADLDQEETVH
jgi:hypothetical protein